MRIEILSGQDDPKIYPLSKDQVIIGTSESCDIVLSDDEVSRKHVQIITEDEKYFVVDQGSTNGSFLNDERLIPGRRVEFTSFFPVRLGSEVLITLLSDEENTLGQYTNLNSHDRDKSNPGIRPQEQTRAISFKELQAKGRTEDLIKKRQESMNQKKLAAKKVGRKKKTDDFRMGLAFILALGLVGGAVFFNLYSNENVRVPDSGFATLEAPAPVTPRALPEALDQFKFSERELLVKGEFTRLFSDFKCVSDLEKYLCQAISGLSEPWGVTQVLSKFVVMIDGTSEMEEMEKNYPRPEAGATADYLLELQVRSLEYFVLNRIPRTLDFEKLKDFDFYFVFYLQNEQERSVGKVMAFRAQGLKTFLEEVPEDLYSSLKDVGTEVMRPYEKYFTLY